MDIKTLLDSGANVTLSVTPADLREFALAIAKEIIDSTKEVVENPLQKDYFTMAEATGIFRVDFSTLYNWNRKGYLKSFKIGGRVYYRRSDVEALLQDRQSNG